MIVHVLLNITKYHNMFQSMFTAAFKWLDIFYKQQKLLPLIWNLDRLLEMTWKGEVMVQFNVFQIEVKKVLWK